MTHSTPARSARLEARLTEEQKTLFERAARVTGRSMTGFVLGSAADEALRVIREAEVLELSAVDSAAFAAAILNPPMANERLRKAALRYTGSPIPQS